MRLAAASARELIILCPGGEKKEAVSTTWDTGDENRETQPIRASTLADGPRLLAAFQVNHSSSEPAREAKLMLERITA